MKVQNDELPYFMGALEKGYMSYSLKLLTRKGGYIEDYTVQYHRGY